MLFQKVVKRLSITKILCSKGFHSRSIISKVYLKSECEMAALSVYIIGPLYDAKNNLKSSKYMRLK